MHKSSILNFSDFLQNRLWHIYWCGNLYENFKLDAEDGYKEGDKSKIEQFNSMYDLNDDFLK